MRFLVAALIVLVAACAPSTPETRIEANRAAYQALSARQQTLVSQGQIEEGMPSQAVYIAWGRPGRDYIGEDEGTATRVWEYTGAQPVYSTNYAAGYGYGYGRYGGYGRYRRGAYYGYDISPQVTYVPYRKASVWFRNDRVTKWERTR
ncbi:hypothetical protein [Haloferula sp.]|uniref:hypothetical protein n=1 Tax=Haloferula sp. TaxID=2497595 RepID=UPI003C7189A9